MSTFMFKNNNNRYTPISNVFIDKYMPNARGEFVKVYILGLKYCISGEIGVNSAIFASTLHLLETDIINAWNYWNDENVIKMTAIDNMGNYNIEFLDLDYMPSETKNNVNFLEKLNNKSIKDMLQDIEKLIARPLSPKEMEMYINWGTSYNFTPEIILLLIQYCISKGKTDYRYIEKVAISWHDAKITTVDEAQLFIRMHEEKWENIRKIMEYLGLKNVEIMKPQEQLIDKWFNIYKYNVDIIKKACDICCTRLNRADFKYIDGILNSWHNDGLKTLDDVLSKGMRKNKNSNKPNSNNKSNFTNYTQRDYDFNDLEKKLLKWENKYD